LNATAVLLQHLCRPGSTLTQRCAMTSVQREPIGNPPHPVFISYELNDVNDQYTANFSRLISEAFNRLA
jgi:hypothetical protein